MAEDEYDNFIGKKESSSFEEMFFGDDASQQTEADPALWKKYWKGMPDFQNDANPPFKKIYVSFRTKEDFEEFQQLINQKMTIKTKSVWHPALDRSENALMRWIEDGESNDKS